MTCPFCQSANNDTAKFCVSCGAKLPERKTDPVTGDVIAATTAAKPLFGAAARKARIEEIVSPDAIISNRAYNVVITGVLLWGIAVNFLLCKTVGNIFDHISPVLFYILYAALAFGGIFLSARSNKPALSFLGYNMVVVPFGLVISTLVEYYAKMDPAIVTDAFLYTMLVAIGMMGVVMVAPQLFAKLGGALGAVLIGLILCEVVLLIFRVEQTWMDWLFAGLFGLFIGYDLYRSQQYPKTLDNAVDSALDLYMDFANLFIRILRILAASKDSK